jgi:hypothetical protein
VAFRGKSPTVQTIIADCEFETLLQRTSAIFKTRERRLLKFPHKSRLKRLSCSRTRKSFAVRDTAGESVEIWLRGLDSNQDNQLQRLACYQLHYPGLVFEIVADIL